MASLKICIVRTMQIRPSKYVLCRVTKYGVTVLYACLYLLDSSYWVRDVHRSTFHLPELTFSSKPPKSQFGTPKVGRRNKLSIGILFIASFVLLSHLDSACFEDEVRNRNRLHQAKRPQNAWSGCTTMRTTCVVQLRLLLLRHQPKVPATT